MSARARLLNYIVAAVLPLFLTCTMVMALDQEKLDGLFTRLQSAGEEEAGRIETEIWIEWSKSGSPALDLLLQRGRDAMAVGEFGVAVEHFTAIIDQDPSFAEAWNARATAYYNSGDYGPSVADIAQVLALNPKHFGALTGFASILEETGKTEQALEVYKAALAIHPHLEGVIDAVSRLETQAEGQEL
ncbi:MAG: tetratricopeptide repeat protein [Rhodobacteraceae bacterium]|nr:tetratricopeptide repeat protein [Paracoccaceae bacterium]